ncbi:MAG TPA: acyltransferase, partial [Candidatus Dormibacteraeota bacterium]|nr:acyltransferase [Candidatus Dormibacteraeota bacterium]
MQATAPRAMAEAPAEPARRPRPDRRLPELDLLRATALIAVVFIHAASWIPGQDAPAQRGPYAAAMLLARFCVPAFVLASGFALHHAYGRPADARAFLHRRALRTMVPWLAWVPVYAAIDLVYGKVAASPHDLAVWLAYGPGHLYFLVLVAQLAVLLPFLPAGRGRLALVAGALVALQLALGTLHTYAPVPAGPLAWPFTYLPQMEAPFWAGWFLLGCLLSACYERFRALSRLWPLALGAAVLGAVAVLFEATLVPADQWRQGTYAFLWPTRLPATLAVVALLLWAGRELGAVAGHRLWAPVRALSQRSLGVYVLHVGAIEVLAHTPLISLPPVLRLAVLMAGSLTISYLVAGALTRTGA